MPLPRRHFLLGLAATSVGGLALSACAASPGLDAAPAAGTSTPTAEPGALPVTITHKFGQTVIEQVPLRVVTVGLKEQDDLLALGLVPVGATKWLPLEQDGVIGPWASSALGDQPAPKALDATDGLPFEQIAALRPDLVLALYSGLTEEQYTKLSAIARVVGPLEGYVDYGIPWDVQAETVGRAVGQPARMAERVAASKKALTDAAAAHPQFAGRTSMVVTPYEGLFAYGAEDPRCRLMVELGFTLPPGFGDLFADGAGFGGNISAERADILDVDALVCFAEEGDEQRKIETALFKRLDVHRQRRTVWLRKSDRASDPFSFLTVLSLPYLLEAFLPRVAAAVDGDPATSTDQPG